MAYFIAPARLIKSGVLKKVANQALTVLLVLVSSSLRLYSQESKGWLFVAQAPAYTTWRANDIIESEEGGFVVSFLDEQHNDSHILKLSKEGELEAESEVFAQDTTIIVSRLYANDDPFQGYTGIALCMPESGSASAIMTLQFDEDLNVLERKVVSCDGLSRPVFNYCVLKQDNNFILAITDFSYSHYLVKLDLTGEMLEWNRVEEEPLFHICNLFNVVGGSEPLFAMYAHVANSGAMMGVLVFDESLQLVSRADFDHWQNEEAGGQTCLYSLYDAINSMMMPLPDSSGYLISSRLEEALFTVGNTLIKSDRSTILAKTDLDFVMQDNYEVIEHLNDTIEQPAYYKSADCHSGLASQSCVYQCTMQGFENQSGWPMHFRSIGVIITKADEDINVVWKKRFLCDKEYFPFAIAATHDGGCAVTGMVYDFNQERRVDLFVLRIAADGTVGVDEIQEESLAFVYPNPAKDVIRIEGVEARETRVYNALGQQVMSFKGNEANSGTLKDGIYLLKITDSEGHTQTLRIVVNK